MVCPGAKSMKGTEDKGGRPSLSGAHGEPSCLGDYGGNEAHRARRTARPWRIPGRILGARRRRLPAPLVTLLRKGRRLRGARPVRSTWMSDNSGPQQSQGIPDSLARKKQKASTMETAERLKAKAKAQSNRKSSKTAEKEASRHQALERELSRARQPAPGDADINTSTPTVMSLLEPQLVPSNLAPRAWSPQRKTVQLEHLFSQGVESQRVATPGTLQSGVQATFTPTAAGRRPSAPPWPDHLPAMVAQAFARFMASSVGQRPQQVLAAASRPSHQAKAPAFLQEASSKSDSEDFDPSRWILSDDEDVSPPDPAPLTGLFDQSLFGSLLLKACSSANIAPEQEAQPAPSTSQPVVTQKHIPCPPLFRNTVQEQWANLGSLSTPGVSERNLFNVAPSFASLLEVPLIDEPLNSLFSNSTIPGDMAEALKAEDKKFESALCRSHQASAWAVKASISLAFFSRVSIMWLRELQDLVPPDQVRAHQNLGKLVATSQYMADASLHAARYSSRAIAADISARRLLWLKNWRADLKAKWRLATQPYNGRHLFGEALNPYLVEGKDKRKTMINMSRRGDWQSGSGTSHHYFHRQSFHPASNWDWPQTPRTFTQRPDRQQDRPAPRANTQFQTTQPFQVSGGRPFRRTK